MLKARNRMEVYRSEQRNVRCSFVNKTAQGLYFRMPWEQIELLPRLANGNHPTNQPAEEKWFLHKMAWSVWYPSSRDVQSLLLQSQNFVSRCLQFPEFYFLPFWSQLKVIMEFKVHEVGNQRLPGSKGKNWPDLSIFVNYVGSGETTSTST